MTALSIALVGLFALVGASWFAGRVRDAEARFVGISATGVAVGSAALVGLASYRTSEAVWAFGGLRLMVDAFAATQLAPIALVLLALVLSMPRSETGGAVVRALLLLGAASWLAVLADGVAVLLAAEAIGAASAARLLSTGPGRAARLYLLVATGLFAGAAVLSAVQGVGAAAIEGASLPVPVAVLATLAALVRLGVVPFQSGATAAVRGGVSVGHLAALLPFGGVGTLIRLAHADVPLPAALPVLLLAAAVLAAALAVVQGVLGRVLAFVLVATHALVALGAVVPDDAAFVGAELLWPAALLSGAGFGIAVALTSARFGPVDLTRLGGRADQAPGLALFFLGAGVACAGTPGTLDFVAADMVLNGAVSVPFGARLLGVAAMSLVGFAVIRAFFRTFYGPARSGAARVDLRSRERIALLLLAGALVTGGLAPSFAPLLSSLVPVEHAR